MERKRKIAIHVEKTKGDNQTTALEKDEKKMSEMEKPREIVFS